MALVLFPLSQANEARELTGLWTRRYLEQQLLTTLAGRAGAWPAAGFHSTALRLVFPRQCTQSAEHGAIHHESTRSRTCWRFRADPSSQQAEPSQPNKLSPTCSLTAAEELIYGLDDMSTMHQMRITDARRIVQARLVSASARVDGCGEVAVQPERQRWLP